MHVNAIPVLVVGWRYMQVCVYGAVVVMGISMFY
jgi:hypothetical protein